MCASDSILAMLPTPTCNELSSKCLGHRDGLQGVAPDSLTMGSRLARRVIDLQVRGCMLHILRNPLLPIIHCTRPTPNHRLKSQRFTVGKSGPDLWQVGNATPTIPMETCEIMLVHIDSKSADVSALREDIANLRVESLRPLLSNKAEGRQSATPAVDGIAIG
ncbi:unnamed protein product [Hydatigera taeniaeformis]|uniref:Chaperone protein DnaJ n=1 Tax=Hydatigena taeniaeformis TaxID=6205 RepID=A0A0R3WPV1_HYDTA|nr:unnamed protein product [Hydatigera taeniaeformis]